MRREHQKREQELLSQISLKADDYARLDRWYREELEAEKERHRRELADVKQRHSAKY